MLDLFRNRIGRSLCAMLFLAGLMAGGTRPKTPPAGELHSGLLFEALGVSVQRAEHDCVNWAWAAAVESLLARSGMRLGQGHWIDVADGGACINDERPITAESISAAVAGDYVLEDGRRVRVAVKIMRPPLNADAVLAPLAVDRPVILLLGTRAVLATRAWFDELAYGNGARKLMVRQFGYTDPASGEDGTLSVEEASRIVAVLDVSVSDIVP